MAGRRTSPRGHFVVILLALGLLSGAPAMYAGSGGSVYSRFGIGDLRPTTSTALFGLGGTGLAVMPFGSVNDLNPAAWAGIGKIRFTAGALYEGYSTSDGASSAYLAGTNFNGFSLAVPLSSSNGVTVAAGIIPFSRINYHIVTPETRTGLEYTMTYKGEGGISRAFTGASVTLAPGLHAAARFEYLFGTLRYSMTQVFGTSTYAGAGLIRSEHVKGFGSTIGVLFEGLGSLFQLPEDRTLAIGMTFSPTTYPTSETERIYTYDADPSTTAPDSSIEGETTFRLPLSFGSGISYRSPKMLLAVDARYQEWAGTTFGTSPEVQLRNSLRLSAGAEFYRDVDPNPATSRKVTYAIGVFHEGGYLEVRNTTIHENGFSAGISFPILNETRISFAASFSLRGSNDDMLQEDKIIRVSASLNISDIWFQRPVEE